jgi:hypothetical protein
MPSELTTLLVDANLTWSQRRTRLQGWSGPDAIQADANPAAQRIASAVCAIGAAAGAWTGSAVLLGVLATTALVGVFAPNHPFEWLYNHLTPTQHRLPANRAAKRLGCAIGVVFLGASAVAYASGATTVGLVLAVVLACTAAFVAVTRICVPSIVFSALWGTQRAKGPSLTRMTGDELTPSRGNPFPV